MTYRIQALTKAEFEALRTSWIGEGYWDRVIEHCAREQVAYLAIDPEPAPGDWFTWLCPDCGCDYSNRFGEQAVSGWNEPRWTIDGYPDRVTLSPSLGCGRMLSPRYAGGHHWWLAKDSSPRHRPAPGRRRPLSTAQLLPGGTSMNYVNAALRFLEAYPGVGILLAFVAAVIAHVLVGAALHALRIRDFDVHKLGAFIEDDFASKRAVALAVMALSQVLVAVIPNATAHQLATVFLAALIPAASANTLPVIRDTVRELLQLLGVAPTP